MLIVGELINSSRKNIEEAIERSDAGFIKSIAERQIEAGAGILDVNCATFVDDEIAKLEWLIKTIQSAVDAPISIDSPNPKAIEAGLKLQKRPSLINSITGQKERMNAILPLAKKYNASLVALAMDDKGIPDTAQKRLEVAKKIVRAAGNFGIPATKIFIDPIIKPISTEQGQANEFLTALRLIKENLKGVNTICGLSNISFGLPNRHLLNQVFLTLSIFQGLDAAILNPLDKELMLAIKAENALLGKDQYCMEFIKAYKAEKAKK